MSSTSRTKFFKNSLGFTAIELLIVVALLGVFVALALPSFAGAIKRWRVNAAALEVSNALQFARAEAIRTRQPVTVAQTATPVNCAQANLLDWSCGIDVLDGNQNLLKTIPATDLKALAMQLATTSTVVNITFDPMGFVRNNVTDYTINVCPAVDGVFPPPPSSYLSVISLGQGGQISISSPH